MGYLKMTEAQTQLGNAEHVKLIIFFTLLQKKPR